LLEANRIIADRDKKIEELKGLLSENRLGSGQATSSLFLPNNLTLLIRQFQSTDFILEHDGHAIVSVRPAREDEMSAVAAATAAARLSRSGRVIDFSSNNCNLDATQDADRIHQ
jgi:hypothetical protein